jgi:hypothetical protein
MIQSSSAQVAPWATAEADLQQAEEQDEDPEDRLVFSVAYAVSGAFPTFQASKEDSSLKHTEMEMMTGKQPLLLMGALMMTTGISWKVRRSSLQSEDAQCKLGALAASGAPQAG